MATTNKYYDQAASEYDIDYNSQKLALANQLASNQQSYHGQKVGINTNYDTLVKQQNLANTQSKNNISNSALGRGLSRSSIVTSGLAQSDMANTRQVGYINNQRLGELNNVEEQLRVLGENYNNSIATLDGSRESAIMKLARELEDRDWDKNFQTESQNMQKDMNLWTKEYQGKQLSMEDEMNKWTKEYQGKQLSMEDEMNQWTKQYQTMQHNLAVRAQQAEEAYQQAQIGLQRAANAAQASYWNQQMALAKQELEYAQRMTYDQRNGAVANMMEIMNSDMAKGDKVTALNAMGMSGDSYVDQLARQYAGEIEHSVIKVAGQGLGKVGGDGNNGTKQKKTTNTATTPYNYTTGNASLNTTNLYGGRAR